MSWDAAAWMVKGARHPAESGRLLAYASARGNEGIIEPTDLKVIPLAVPGNQVRVGVGSAFVTNRSAGATQQSYVIRNATEDLSPTVTATGSGSGRSDLVIARVADPQYAGTAAPPNPLTDPYVFTRIISGVPNSTKTARELNLGYPAIALARLDIPASTSAITAAMIVDLRKSANPRREPGSGVYYPIAKTMTKLSYTDWPFTAGSEISVDVPFWATGVQIECNISGVEFTGAAGAIQTAGVRTVFDGVTDQHQALIGYGAVERQFVQIIGKHTVTAAQRGTTRVIKLQGNHSAGAGAIKVDTQSTIALKWEFTEAAA